MSEHHIKSLSISRLFSRYSYDIPQATKVLSELNIWYGANGLGKTTLLTLVYQLLTVAKFPAHVEAISKTVFEHLKIVLNDGTEISARKDAQILIGPVIFEVKRPGQKVKKWGYVPGQQTSITASNLPKGIDLARIAPSLRKEVEYAFEQRDFLNEISQLQASTYMLTSDRMLLGDATAAERDNRIAHERARARISDLVVAYRNEAIIDSLKTTSRWLQDKFLGSSYRATGTSNVYEDVITRVASTAYKTRGGLSTTAVNEVKSDLLSQIDLLNKNSKGYQKLGLGATGISESLIGIIGGCSGNRLFMVQEVLRPYLAELKNRQERIEPTYKLVKRFTTAVNRFFQDKEISFDILAGLKIFVKASAESDPVEIEPDQLSSGEKQLIFILCRVLTASGRTSIFIIDEPEISMNVVWQRILVSTLIELASDEDLQFILASHSMEIIAQHSENVIVLSEED